MIPEDIQAALFAAAPPNAKYVAMDEDTTWWWFTEYPKQDTQFNKWTTNPEKPGIMRALDYQPIVRVKWDESLLTKDQL
jgi:hypothetical protein